MKHLTQTSPHKVKAEQVNAQDLFIAILRFGADIGKQ